jgi:glycosyltransferase involved in cell wall biosynthesis
LKLALVSPRTRVDLHQPLENFQELDVKHFYFEGDVSKNGTVPATQVKGASDLRSRLESWGPDLIQAPEPYFALDYLPLLWTMYQLDTPYFIPWLETRRPTTKFGYVLGSILRRCTRPYVDRARFLWPVTPRQSKLLDHLSFDTHVTEPSLWGTWGTRIPDVTSPEERADRQRFLFLGRLEPEKGVCDLIEAWSTVSSKIDWELDCAGAGSMEPAVRQFARRDDLRYLGYLEGEPLEEQWRRTSVLVSPSRSTPGWEEQVGMSNIQALGRGSPVVSTRTGAIPHVIQDGEHGLLVEERSPDRLAEAMCRLAEDRSLYETLARQARERAIDCYDSQSVVREAEQKLRRLVEKVGLS